MDWFRRKGSSRATHTAPTHISKMRHVPDGQQHEDGLLSPGVMVPSAASLRVEAGYPSSRSYDPSGSEGTKLSSAILSSSVSAVSEDPRKGLPQSSDGVATFAFLQEGMLRYHTGIVDQATLTTMEPAIIMNNVYRALSDMGIEAKKEGDAKLRCVRLRNASLQTAKIGQSDRVGSRTVSRRSSPRSCF